MMANFVLEDDQGYIDIIAFPDTFKKYSSVLAKDSSVLIKGSIEVTDKGPKIHAKTVLPLESDFNSDSFSVEVNVSSSDPKESLVSVKKIVQSHSGKCPLYVKLSLSNYEATIATQLGLTINRETIESFKNIFGNNRVRITHNELIS
jgi:DNA polymerase-3 subunit alpha